MVVAREIFLGQGKYVVKILRSVGLEDRRSMSMPMITNLRKLSAYEGEFADPTLYRELIGSFGQH